MAQKKVSYEVAKALKEAGYPQGEVHITEIGWYNKAGVFTKELPFLWKGDDAFVALAPTYIDAWLWLWRNKGIMIDTSRIEDCVEVSVYTDDWECLYIDDQVYPDPEEAIASAIDYLVKNNLIK